MRGAIEFSLSLFLGTTFENLGFCAEQPNRSSHMFKIVLCSCAKISIASNIDAKLVKFESESSPNRDQMEPRLTQIDFRLKQAKDQIYHISISNRSQLLLNRSQGDPQIDPIATEGQTQIKVKSTLH